MRRAAALARRWLAAPMAALALAAFAVAPAAAETLVTSLSTHRVLIGSNYTGAQIAVFGLIERDARSVARPGPYDLVVTITGPRQHVLVREKRRQGFVWVNDEQRRYGDAPAFLAVLSSRPLAEIGSEEDRRTQRIGLRNRLTPAGAGMSFDAGESRFTDALIRIRASRNLYQEVERGVTFLAPGLFRAAINLPATAPAGSYEVLVELYAGAVQLARQQTNFEVVQIGFEEGVGLFARHYSLAYGLVTALLALLSGWTATVIFRRD